MTKKTVYMIVAVVLALSAVAEMCGVHMHGAHWWPLPFGYNIFFGFVGCWALIIVSKMIMAPIHNYSFQNDYGSYPAAR